MVIDLEDKGYLELLKHLGHELGISHIGSTQEPSKITIECRKCGVVLIRCKRPKEMDRKWKKK